MASFGLRVTDQETARVVAICRGKTEEIVGAGCLVSDRHILTCRHVVAAAVGGDKQLARKSVRVKLVGVTTQPTVTAEVERVRRGTGLANDLALLAIRNSRRMRAIPPVQFATPLRHSRKSFSAFGFPDGDPQGRHASGSLHGADALGLVQMDGASSLLVKGGFSGAPVWSPDVGSFVGLIVTELWDRRVAWCIPSRLLCQFHPDLHVLFRMPPADRPTINDYAEDDPNVSLFGSISQNGERRLTAKVEWDCEEGRYVATVVYQVKKGSPLARGGYVTFITHPSFTKKSQDSYELFALIDDTGKAEQEFYPSGAFTVAAVGDGGDTALTVELDQDEF